MHQSILRKIIYGKIKVDIGTILGKLCEHNGVEIIETSSCKDYKHMLASIPSKLNVLQFMKYIKRKNSLMIFDRHVN